MGIDLLTAESLSRLRRHDPFMPMEYLMEQLPSLFGRLLPILVQMFLSDVVGRKKLVRYSLRFGTVSMLVMNVSFFAVKYQFINPRAIEEMNKWSIAAVLGSFSLGLGPVTWVHTSEILPFKVRAQLIGIIVTMNRLISFGLEYLNPFLEKKVVAVRPFLYLVLNILIMLGSWCYGSCLIETKQQSLEEMDQRISPMLELNLGHTCDVSSQ
ncbi:unnamed protein product [Linum trigynum]|uniref:Major facilitator superfamily (MFS) profile domain-containing protein n=1 Tax=Linum trigynum TaxID=586398 RepID=A0AAV2D745_9ROSI